MFTDKHDTPWGRAINLDDRHSDGVRHFFIDNALHWLREYHIDGLRLDATHALKDDTDPHFLIELRDRVHADVDGPRRHLIAEDPRNINTLLRPRDDGGFGLDGIWTDDFHHQIRHLTAGDSEGYFASYAGHTADELATTVRDGWYYRGQIFPASGEPWGTDPSGIDLDQCVICIQNHDQVGNRPKGNRLTDDIPLPVYRAASALLLFAPETPLLFMGQEWAASTPFQFFTDHNEELGQDIREGRREEFADFSGFDGTVPDPQDSATFERSRLDWVEADRDDHARTRALYRDLLALRADLDGSIDTEAHGDFGLTVRRGHHILLVALADDTTLPRPPDTKLVTHTEHPTYAADGLAPIIDADTVHFPRASAAVMVAA
jgi:maltooligosyltrehalose trehalohydrolase